MHANVDNKSMRVGDPRGISSIAMGFRVGRSTRRQRPVEDTDSSLRSTCPAKGIGKLLWARSEVGPRKSGNCIGKDNAACFQSSVGFQCYFHLILLFKVTKC